MNPLPVVDAGLDLHLCFHPDTLITANFSSGFWYGSNYTSSGIFSPNSAGVGNHELIFYHQDSNYCDNTDTL